jgi:hypothetical protein
MKNRSLSNSSFLNNIDMDKKFNKTKNTFITIWIISALVSLGFLGVIIFVAMHFIVKVW